LSLCRLASKSPFYIYADPYFVKPSDTKKEQRVPCPDFKSAKKDKKDNPWRDSNPQPSHVLGILVRIPVEIPRRSEKR
jgi:hypothetical protein